MKVDYLMTPEGRRVNIAKNVTMLCTARHPMTGEMLVLDEYTDTYRFERMVEPTLCAPAGNDEPFPPMLDAVTVETELVMVVGNRRY